MEKIRMHFHMKQWPNRIKWGVRVFLILLLVAETMAFVHYNLRIGHGNETTHFVGNEETATEDQEISYAKSLAEVVEIAHPHGFGFALLVAFIALLWGTLDIGDKLWKIWLWGFSIVSIGFVVTPFLIRFVAPDLGWLYGLFGLLYSVHIYTFIFLCWKNSKPLKEPTPIN